MMRDANGKWFISDYATPSFANSQAGLEAYHRSLYAEKESEIAVNELLLKNKGNYPGDSEGYIELINISDHYVDMSAYCLSDNADIPFRAVLPQVNVAPGDVCCVGFSELGLSFDGPSG